ncbi:MAG: response regulator, partial [Candidatus Delongbacteria bacterium]|nr:response regulator [Candidatus Delongbacteria bacterium]
RKKFMKDIREKGESFTTYWYKNPSDSLTHPKTAYFKFFPEFDWVIAKGFYYTQINKTIESETNKHRKNFIIRIVLLLTLMSLALLLYYFTFKIILKKQEKRLKEYKNDLISKNMQLEEEIAKSKSRENELKNLNKYITNLYELTPVGIVLIKVVDKTIVRINQTALNLIGYNKEDILGKKCYVCFCPALKEACPIIDKNNPLDNSERSILNSKKEIIPVLKNAKKITINNEDYILESFIDITMIKKAQNELIDLREKADESNISKSRFLANMSHEIRTPMNVIMGMSSLLLETETDVDKKDLLDSIKISSETLLNIINDILDLSKIESGKYTFEKIPFNLHNLLSRINDISLFKAKENNIHFAIEYSKHEIPENVIFDPLRIEQVIINLIGNAIKFTEEGYVKLILSIVKNEDNVASIKFSVIDTGIGISEGSLKEIFQRFIQADISTTRKYGGTGLGLTICKKLLEMMGSKLEVISIEGEGSEFFFELSLLITDENKVEIADEFVRNPDEFKKLINKKILIAEDNPLNQKLIAAILTQEQINYTIVNNGKETIEKLDKEHFDMVLMDGQMPVMDGLEATRIIRASKKNYKDIPIVALTASALIGDRQIFIDAGMNDYISKPIDIVELFEKILIYTNGYDHKIKIKTAVSSDSSKELVVDNKFELLNLSDFEEKKNIFEKGSYLNILNMLLTDFETKLDLITNFLEDNDLGSLRHQTHSLKGIVTNFDTPKISDLCKELDQYAIDGNTELVKVTLDKIKALAPKYKSEILEFMSSL